MLEIRNFSKTYNRTKKAVSDVSLTVKDGDLFAFIGHNGAGKTTTIKAIAGILDFEEGEILINGMSMKDNPLACKKEIAYIPDQPVLYEHLSGIRYLNFISDVYHIPCDEREKAIGDLAMKFELSEHLGESIHTYSHGMKQKLILISAFMHKPRVLILDEPFVGLDPKAAFVLKQEMKNLCKTGSSIFFSTHVLEVAEKLCNKVAMINEGKLVFTGEMTDITEYNTLENIFMQYVEARSDYQP